MKFSNRGLSFGVFAFAKINFVNVCLRFFAALCIFIFLLLLYSGKSYAVVRTWDGEGTDGTCGGGVGDGEKWSCDANWSDDTQPGASDIATFSPTSTKDANIDSGFAGSVAGVDINSGYTGTITANRSLTVGVSNYDQAAGIFDSTSQAIDLDADFILSGGTFTATSGIMTVGNDFTVSGSPVFNNSSGTITFDGGNTFNTITCGSITFNAVNFSKSAGTTLTVSSGCTIPIAGTDPSLTAGTISNSGTINITGNPTLPSYTSNTGAVLTTTGTSMVLTNTLTLTAGTFPANITTLTIQGSLTNTGSLLPNGIDLTFSGGGTSHTHTCGTVSFDSVTISKGVTSVENINSGCVFPIPGTNPTITGYIVNSGTINVTGNLTITSYSSPSSTSVLTMTGNTISATDDLILTSGAFPSGITTISLARDLDNSGNLLPNNIALSYTGGGGSGNDLNCGTASFASITITKDVASSVRLGSNCTTDDFTANSGGSIANPSSSRTVYITGDFSYSASLTLGGANLTLEFTGSAAQTLSHTDSGVIEGTIGSILRINKTGSNAASLTTNFVISTQTCTVVEGIFDTNGKNFECGSTFTAEDGGTLRLVGSERVDDPTLNTGSTVVYKGDGDGSADTYLIKDWSYVNLTASFTDSGDTLDAPTSDTLTSSEVGYWKMNEGSGTVEDSSVNNNTATPTNATFATTVPDIEDANPYAMSFDGSGDYLNMGNDLNLAQNLSTFTVAAWVRKANNTGTNQIFGLSTGDSTADSRVAIATTTDEIICSGTAGDTEAVQSRTTSAADLITGVWYHMVCTIDYANDTITIYLNSVSQSATGTVSFTATSTSNTASQRSSIGIDEDKSGNDFSGQIDEVRVYTRALTQNELNALSGGFTTMTISSRTVSNNLTISGGILVSPTTLNVGGNFTNSATFTHNSGTVTLNATSDTKTLTSGGTSFNNLTMNDSGGSLTVELQDALDVNNDLTITGGTLDVKSGSSHQVNVGGDWSNSDTFTARSGLVVLDGTDQQISGTTTFSSLTKNITTPARTLTFPASLTQTFTATLNLSGTSGNLLSLVSSTPTTQARIDPQGTRTISYLDVTDN